MHFTWTLKYIWELIQSNHDGDGQEKISGLAKQVQLCTYITLFVHLLYDYDVKLPSFF